MISFDGADVVRAAAQGVVDRGRVTLWWRAAESAADAREWRTASLRLLNVVDVLPDDGWANAWRRLALAICECAIRARDPDLVQRVAKATVSRGWSRGDEGDDLVVLFRLASQVGALDAGLALGAVVRHRLPKSGWGSYAFADFEERRSLLASRRVPSSVVGVFREAASRFAACAQPAYAMHARLRADVGEAVHSPPAKTRNSALPAVNEIDARDAGWLALGQAHSTFWLHRVRAADWALDRADDDTWDTLAETIAIQVCEQALEQSQPVETERAETLSIALSREVATNVRGRQRVTTSLSPILDTPLRLAREAEFPADASSLEAIVKAWGGTSANATNPVAQAVIEALDAVEDADGGANALYEVTAVASNASPRDLRVCLLAILRSCDVGHEELRGPVTRLSLHVAAGSAAPSFGFAHVSAALARAGHSAASAAFARRAFDEGESGQLLQECVARAVRWAAETGTDSQLLSWLEVAESANG